MKWNAESFEIQEGAGLKKGLLALGIAGLVLSGLIYALDAGGRESFFFSYLTSFVFWVTIGLGALFLTLVHHLVNATWSVVFRRIFENLMASLPILIILFIPIIFGMQYLYTDWMDHSQVSDPTKLHLLEHKAPWLNPKFFILRAAIYFAIWAGIGLYLRKISLRQDEEGNTYEIHRRMRIFSGPAMVLFALSTTFMAFDWLMTLDPYWFSTIWGVYIFAGSVLGVLCFTTIFTSFLRSNGVLKDEVSIEHYHDLGKLTFAFIVFWTYIAFSQLILIWYANIPEETIFYLRRWDHGIYLLGTPEFKQLLAASPEYQQALAAFEAARASGDAIRIESTTLAMERIKESLYSPYSGNWKMVSMFLLIFHFCLPFVLLISRVPKRRIKVITFMAFWVIFMHYVDLKWIVMGSQLKEKEIGSAMVHELPVDFSIGLADVTTFIGIGGIFLAYFWHLMISKPVVPVKDPILKKSIKFINI